MALDISETPDSLCFNLAVVPRSSKNMIAGCHDGALKVKITAPPVEGKANNQCVEYLAKTLKVPKSYINIVSGGTSKRKRVCIKFPQDPGSKDDLARVKKVLMGF